MTLFPAGASWKRSPFLSTGDASSGLSRPFQADTGTASIFALLSLDLFSKRDERRGTLFWLLFCNKYRYCQIKNWMSLETQKETEKVEKNR